jgi:purine-binding chemotaxis protein CheW
MQQIQYNDQDDVVDTLAQQYLTCKLDKEIFAIEVSRVREVLDMVEISRVPNSPSYMRGMINVRGSVIPVMDLCLKFGMTGVETTLDTRIIVLEVIDSDGDNIVVGALADAVHEVTELNEADVEEAPRIGTRWNTDFIRGIGKRNEEFIVILNIDKVFSADELTTFSQVQGEVR